jgi:hypothetical protein
MRDPWDPQAVGDEAKHPDGGYVHHTEPAWSRDPDMCASDQDYYADRAARRDEAQYWGQW